MCHGTSHCVVFCSHILITLWEKPPSIMLIFILVCITLVFTANTQRVKWESVLLMWSSFISFSSSVLFIYSKLPPWITFGIMCLLWHLRKIQVEIISSEGLWEAQKQRSDNPQLKTWVVQNNSPVVCLCTKKKPNMIISHCQTISQNNKA